MAKIILSPLFLFFIIIWPTVICLLICFWKKNKKLKFILGINIVALLIFTLFSLNVTTSVLGKHLVKDISYEFECPFDAVVVLSGGVFLGNIRENDSLDGETSLRLIKGVEVFKKCGSRRLVLTGGNREVELMQNLSLNMGVPENRIILEKQSSNTREHVLFLKQEKKINSNMKLAIVSSPWHLKRAMQVFAPAFPNSVPVPAYFFPSKSKFNYKSLLPTVHTLRTNTYLLHEYIGMIWYWIRDR